MKRSIVYIDESGFAVDSPRTHGYSTRGSRCYGKYDWNARERINAIGALINKTLFACNLYEHTINSDTFKACVADHLLPASPVNSVFILDNASIHKRKDILDLIRAAGHTLLFQPTYSPDLNRIEKKWNTLKSKRRKDHLDVPTLFYTYAKM